MAVTRRVVLRLEAIISDQQPIRGLVRASSGHSLTFSGWSEMFAVLQALTCDPGVDTGLEDTP